MTPRSLIFDLDDTLIASFDTYAMLHQRIAGELDFPVPTRAELVPYGETWQETLETLWPDRDVRPFMDAYDALVDDHPYPGIPGAAEVLEELAGSGHPLWIVTKRSRRRLDLRMRQAGLRPSMFRGIFAVEDQPASKPDPRCFDPVWAARGAADPHAVYVGDRRDDAHAADRAGLEFVGVRSGPESELDFSEHIADTHLLDSVVALPRWLEQWGPRR